MVTIETILIEEKLKKQKGVKSCHHTKTSMRHRQKERGTNELVQSRKQENDNSVSIIALGIGRLNSNHNT